MRRAEVFDLLRQACLEVRELRRTEAADVHCVRGRGAVSAWIEEGGRGWTDLLLLGGGRGWLLVLSFCRMEWREGMLGWRIRG